MKKIAFIASALALVFAVPALAEEGLGDHQNILVNAIDMSRPWGIPTVTIGGAGGVAEITITNGGMSSYEPIDQIKSKPDARYGASQPVWDVAFLADPHRHPVLNSLEYCLAPVNEDNEVFGPETCATPSPSMSFRMAVRPGTTRLLPVMRQGGQKFAWGWQPERGTHPFEGWRAIFVTNTGDEVRDATPAEISKF